VNGEATKNRSGDKEREISLNGGLKVSSPSKRRRRPLWAKGCRWRGLCKMIQLTLSFDDLEGTDRASSYLDWWTVGTETSNCQGVTPTASTVDPRSRTRGGSLFVQPLARIESVCLTNRGARITISLQARRQLMTGRLPTLSRTLEFRTCGGEQKFWLQSCQYGVDGGCELGHGTVVGSQYRS
jgi:hypothetical protein